MGLLLKGWDEPEFFMRIYDTEHNTLYSIWIVVVIMCGLFRAVHTTADEGMQGGAQAGCGRETEVHKQGQG